MSKLNIILFIQCYNEVLCTLGNRRNDFDKVQCIFGMLQANLLYIFNVPCSVANLSLSKYLLDYQLVIEEEMLISFKMNKYMTY